MSKLMFFDIDGTLIDDHHQLPPTVIPALNRAKEKGCLLFINTGRTLCNMDARLAEIPLDGRITGCGARVTLRGRTLRAVEYDLATSLRIRQALRSVQMPAVYECDTGMYFDPEGATWPAIEGFRAFSDRMGLTRIIREDDPEFRAVKMFVFSEEKKQVEEMLAALAEAGCPFEAIDRGGAGWEVVPAGCSKAAGIEILREELGVKLEDCYAFGDSNNDLSMLTHVPHSVAMGNAPKELQSRCWYVAPRPEENGIARALEHLGLS
ncbi:MAG: HAD family phosphatase [Clostridia bacterium]|nr:HAD family phosphatase [Clostridia bacterium]